MAEALALVAVAAFAFAATNVDDLFVLTAFFADPSARARHVVAGQYLGIAALTAASLLCAFAALALASPWLGLLGILPMAIGVRKLVVARRRDGVPPSRRTAGAAVLSVAAVTVANGGDNLAIYVPLFATRGEAQWLLIVIVFAVLTGVWCAAGRTLVAHPALGRPLRRHGHRLLPWLLIVLGMYILASSGLPGVLM